MVELVRLHKGAVYGQRNGLLIPVITDGLVGYWPMTEGSGTTLYDESKHGNDGTINGPTWADVANGKALDFDGVDDYVDITSTAMNELGSSNGEFTISAWVKFDTVAISGYGQCIVDDWHDGDAHFILRLRNDNLQLYVADPDTVTVVSSTTLDADVWTHLVEVADGSALKIYINGEQDTNTQSYSGNIQAGSNKVIIGANDDLSNGFLDGKIDEVRIYDRALSAEEINNIFQKTRGIYGV